MDKDIKKIICHTILITLLFLVGTFASFYYEFLNVTNNPLQYFIAGLVVLCMLIMIVLGVDISLIFLKDTTEYLLEEKLKEPINNKKDGKD